MTYARRRVGSHAPILIVALALVAIASSLAASSARAAGGNTLQLGYADSERANPTHFPTPWAGDPGVIFEGCQPTATTTCTFDSSAIRIINNTGSTETVNSVVVKFPGAAAGGGDCTIDIWPHNVSLPAGDSLILAQTANKAASGCNNPAGTIDGSEMGPNGVDWGGGTHCSTNSGIIPQVITTIDGTTTTTNDSSQVLNTGGDDTNSCPFPINGGRNESEQWTTGSCVNGAATLVLAPPTQTHFVGQTATITGTFDNTCGQPIQGAAVTFHDLIGPDTGMTGTGTTDVNGQASLTYTGNFVGTDTWDATITNPGGTITSNTVNVIWIQPPCPTSTKANFRWHYSANGSSGSWSATKGVTCPGSLSIGPSTMEGDLKVSPGTTLKAGYDFNIPGNSTTLNINVNNPQAVFTVRCVSGATPSQSTLTVPMPTATYTVTNSQWIPSGDQQSPLVYEGSITVPDLCSGGQLRLDKGGTFTATVN